MDWLLGEKREKSLASNAKKIVADMHTHLEKEKRRNRELQEMVVKFQILCTESIESDIQRLELRKVDLKHELEQVDKDLYEKRIILENTKKEIRNLLEKCVQTTSSGNETEKVSTTMSIASSSQDHTMISPSANSGNHNTSFKSSDYDDERVNSDIDLLNKDLDDVDKLESQYMEEIEILDTCREVVTHFLFMIHKNDSKDIFAYSLASKGTRTDRFFEVCKVSKILTNPKTSSLEESEFFYQGKIIPNHDRDYPEIKEMEIPISLLSKKEKVVKTAVIFGQLIGAFELPLIPDLAIDVWTTEKRSWATTIIDNVDFALLERIFITSQILHGVSTIVQIDIFGRHPKTGRILVETIVATAD